MKEDQPTSVTAPVRREELPQPPAGQRPAEGARGAAPRAPVTGIARFLYVVLGCFFVLLGTIGAALPVMPTTIFLILAAWCFARSSPRLHARLLAHPLAGPALRNWEEERAISARGKVMACAGMALGYGVFLWSARPDGWLAAVVALFMAGCALYVVRRPGPGS